MRIEGILYLVLQLVIFMRLTIAISEQIQQGERYCAALAITSICFVSGIVLCVGGYYFFGFRPECRIQILYVCLTIIFGIMVSILSVLQITNKRKEMTLFTSSIVFLYCSYLLETSLLSIPVVENGNLTHCFNALNKGDIEPTTQTLFI